MGYTTRPGRCAICKLDLPEKELVYFDAFKRQGSHLAHKKCYDDLMATRDIHPPRGKDVLSTEPLDPPF